jgi:hypothetical protein
MAAASKGAAVRGLWPAGPDDGVLPIDVSRKKVPLELASSAIVPALSFPHRQLIYFSFLIHIIQSDLLEYKLIMMRWMFSV